MCVSWLPQRGSSRRTAARCHVDGRHTHPAAGGVAAMRGDCVYDILQRKRVPQCIRGDAVDDGCLRHYNLIRHRNSFEIPSLAPCAPS